MIQTLKRSQIHDGLFLHFKNIFLFFSLNFYFIFVFLDHFMR